MQYLVQTTFFIIGSYMRYIFLKDSHSLSLVMLLNAFKFTFPDIFGNYVLRNESWSVLKFPLHLSQVTVNW